MLYNNLDQDVNSKTNVYISQVDSLSSTNFPHFHYMQPQGNVYNNKTYDKNVYNNKTHDKNRLHE